MTITRLEQVFETLKNNEKKTLIAAFANDSHTIEAVGKAVQMGIINAILVGDERIIKKTITDYSFNIENFTIINEPDEIAATKKAVELINDGKGQVIMKGAVSTDKYMRAILNKENGLTEPKAVLSHITVMETPNYHKLMTFSDVAIIPQPDLNQKITITNYVIKVARALGISKPKVALIAASELVMPKMEASVHASVISKMAERGQIKNASIDGPLSIDAAIDKETTKVKKINSDVAGNADCLIFPNIDAGNVFYKVNSKLAKAELGGIVLGAKVPTVLSSRADSVMTKLYSIALATLVAEN